MALIFSACFFIPPLSFPNATQTPQGSASPSPPAFRPSVSTYTGTPALQALGSLSPGPYNQTFRAPIRHQTSLPPQLFIIVHAENLPPSEPLPPLPLPLTALSLTSPELPPLYLGLPLIPGPSPVHCLPPVLSRYPYCALSLNHATSPMRKQNALWYTPCFPRNSFVMAATYEKWTTPAIGTSPFPPPPMTERSRVTRQHP